MELGIIIPNIRSKVTLITNGKTKKIICNLEYTINDIKSVLNNNRRNLSLHYLTEKNGERMPVTIQKRTKNHIVVSQQITPFRTVWQDFTKTKDATVKGIIVEHSDDKVYREYETVQSINKEHDYSLTRHKETCDKVNNTHKMIDFKRFEYNKYGTKIYKDLKSTI